MQIFFLHAGFVPYNKPTETRAIEGIERALKVLNEHVAERSFVAGDALTLADITLASNLVMLFTAFLGADIRGKFPAVVRYLETLLQQDALASTFPKKPFREETAKYTPPKKEDKKEDKKEAGGAAAAAAPAPAPAKKPKNPLDELPPSSFSLEEWKRVYMNEDTRPKAIPWFYERFDPEGFSVWRFDFKYNDELALTFQSSNQIGGFFSRLEGARKYAWGTAGVFGESNNSAIAGVFVARGKSADVFSAAPDAESYAFTPLDLNKDEDKKFFEDMLAWEATIDGKQWADGKIFR